MRIKALMKELGVTQIELAEKLGINRVSVSRLLSDSNNLRIDTARKIANVIGVPLWQLFVSPGEVCQGGTVTEFAALIKDGEVYHYVTSKEDLLRIVEGWRKEEEK